MTSTTGSFAIADTDAVLRALFLVVIGASGCAHQPSAAERWFTQRGQAATTWHVCARLGASLRAACEGDRACEGRVTSALTRACYAGRYQAPDNHRPSPAVLSAAALSPCFWNREPSPAGTPAQYAQAQCAPLALGPTLEPHCVAELKEVVEGLCAAGAVDLTGAGP